MFTHFTEFYKQALYHFILSALCAVLFALGLEYSKGSDGKTNIPYFMPAMVLSVIHFILTVIAILAFYYARSLSDIYDGLRRWDNSEKHFRRLKPLYLLLLYPSFLWSIVGASMAGNTGICSTEERPCYYTVNEKKNRTVAIVIVVTHVLNALMTVFIMTTTHKLRREVMSETNILHKHKTTPMALKFNPTNFTVQNTNQVKKHAENNNKTKLSPTKNGRTIQKQHSTFEIHLVGASKSRENEKNKRDLLPPIKKPLKRHHTIHDGQIRLADGMDAQSREKDRNKLDIKPLPPNRKNHGFLRTGKLITKLRILAPKQRNGSLIQPNNRALYKDSDDCRTKSDDSNVQPRPHSTKGFPIGRMTELPRVPPPSYDQIMAQRDTDPYWLPPLPHHDPSMHFLPENMYSGHSFPDTEIVPVQPANVS